MSRFGAAVLAALAVMTPTRGEPVRLQTGDGVTLAGRYTPGRDGPRSPAVIVLDDLGPAADPARCDELAAALAADGCAVLCLDFRGHGGSTSVTGGFWGHPTNAALVKPGRDKGVIGHADFRPGYLPALANDVAAARALLALRNDFGECNVGQTIVVGFGSGATVGALWAAAEWTRYRVYPGVPPRLAADPAGRDLAGCIWVGPAAKLDRVPVPLADWVRATAARRTTLTGWLYPPRDKAAARLAERVAGELNKGGGRIVVAEPAADRAGAVAQAARLVRSVRDTTPLPPWDDRGFADRRFAWAPPGGRPVVAKAEGADWFAPLPVELFVRR